MENEDVILVLETILLNPKKDIKNLHIELENVISWHIFLSIFTKLSTTSFIDREVGILSGTVTPLGENKLKQLKKEIKESEEIESLTKQELKGNVFQLKYWWIILLVNAIISLIISLIVKQ